MRKNSTIKFHAIKNYLEKYDFLNEFCANKFEKSRKKSFSIQSIAGNCHKRMQWNGLQSIQGNKVCRKNPALILELNETQTDGSSKFPFVCSVSGQI